jgi:hypothetical protein
MARPSITKLKDVNIASPHCLLWICIKIKSSPIKDGDIGKPDKPSNPEEIGRVFNPSVIQFLENEQPMHIECSHSKLLFYRKLEHEDPQGLAFMSQFAETFIKKVKGTNH